MRTLLDFLISELGQGVGHEARVAAEQAGPDRQRSLIDELLTMRAPGALPPHVQDELDVLLDASVAAAGVIDAATLPTLGQLALGRSSAADRIALWSGDLTRLQADAVVNAANADMLGCFTPGHACIDNAIHRIAGPQLRMACAAHMAAQGHREPTGRATLTPGFHLPARNVIHTVGPVVLGGRPTVEHEEQLASCYRSALDVAEAEGTISTLGFCAISTGVFGYPKEAAARVALGTIRDWLDTHPGSGLRPVVSAYTPHDLAVYRDAVGEVGL